MKLKIISATILCFIMLFSFVACENIYDDFEKGGTTISYVSTKRPSASIIQREDENPNHIVDPNNRFKPTDFGPLMPMQPAESTTDTTEQEQEQEPSPDTVQADE